MKKGMKVIAILVCVLISVFLLASSFYVSYKVGDSLAFDKSGKSCHGNCPDRVENSYCIGTLACNFTIYSSCYNGTCIPGKCGTVCSRCSFSCFNGRCFQNKSDLIISGVSYYFYDSNPYDLGFINISVKNNGTAIALPFTTQILMPSGTIYRLYTTAIPPGETTYVNTTFSEQRGTTLNVHVDADIDNVVDEINETNNGYQIFVTRP